MGIMDYFVDWSTTTATIYTRTESYNPTTGQHDFDFVATADTITGVKWSRSDAERYFSERWKTDVSDILSVAYPANVTNEMRLQIDGVMWDVDSVVDVAKQNEVELIGLKEIT